VLNQLNEQVQRISASGRGALSAGVIIGILLSLWSAMSGVKATMDGLNVVYEQKESRSFIRFNIVALLITLAGFVAFLLAVAAVVYITDCPIIPRAWKRGRGSDGNTALASASVHAVDRMSCALSLWAGSQDGAPAVGERWQCICCVGLDSLLILVLVVLVQFYQLQCHIWLFGSCRGTHDVALDFRKRRATRGRT
jgi:hypothetical protein